MTQRLEHRHQEALAIEAHGLVKVFGETRAVAGIDLEVAPGTVYGVLGPNARFVDPPTMPGWVQAFVNANPITHFASAARGLMHGTAAGGDALWVLVWGVALVAVFAPLSMRL